MDKDYCSIGVIFAGGVGSRMRSKDVPKQFLQVHGKPIIVHTLEKFQECIDIDAIVIACLKDKINYLKSLVEKYRLYKVKKIVAGGESGQMSIYNGLLAAKEVACGKNAVVLIHDGVRPFITQKLLSDNVKGVIKYGSAITAGVVKETTVLVGEDGSVETVMPRAFSRVAKAPQSFYLKDILAAHEKALSENRKDFIDSCALMNHYGYKLRMIDGPYENIKITTPDDYYTMRAILDAKEDKQIYGVDDDNV